MVNVHCLMFFRIWWLFHCCILGWYHDCLNVCFFFQDETEYFIVIFSQWDDDCFIVCCVFRMRQWLFHCLLYFLDQMVNVSLLYFQDEMMIVSLFVVFSGRDDDCFIVHHTREWRVITGQLQYGRCSQFLDGAGSALFLFHQEGQCLNNASLWPVMIDNTLLTSSHACC